MKILIVGIKWQKCSPIAHIRLRPTLFYWCNSWSRAPYICTYYQQGKWARKSLHMDEHVWACRPSSLGTNMHRLPKIRQHSDKCKCTKPPKTRGGGMHLVKSVFVCLTVYFFTHCFSPNKSNYSIVKCYFGQREAKPGTYIDGGTQKG